MTTFPKPTRRRVQSVLLALAFAFLQGFTPTDAKGPDPAGSTPGTAPMRAATEKPVIFAKPECGGFTVTGPSTAYRYSSITFRVSNWSGQCLTWYYDGTYTNTTNGSFTIYIDRYSRSGSVTAIQHSTCGPSGTALYCGFTSFSIVN